MKKKKQENNNNNRCIGLLIMGLSSLCVLGLCLICYFYQFYFGLFLLCCLIFFLLFVVQIWSAHKILSDFCKRKSINSYNIYSNKIYLLLFKIFMLLIPIYKLCTSGRLFVFVNNIALGSFKGVSDEFSSLFIGVIIVILFVSSILSWINVYKKKDRDGKFNYWLVAIAIFGSLLLVFNVLLALGFFKLSYFNSLLYSILSSYVFEIISNLVYFLMGGEVHLVYSLESVNLELP